MRWSEIFSTIDSHAGGQPLRLITFGAPRLQPAPLRDQIREMKEKYDHIRTWLLAEPRGHAGMTGALLVPSIDPEVDYGVIFMSAGGYKPMSGHGMIALATTLIDSGTFPVDGPEIRITFETWAGQIQARASVDKGRVQSVRFRNVPSYRTHKDLEIEYDGRTIQVDVAYGGNWYAIVKAEDLGIELQPNRAQSIQDAGLAVCEAVINTIRLEHSLDPELDGTLGAVIVGSPTSDEYTNRNATVYRNGLIDRSPCGTGMSAAMACLAEDGELQVGQAYVSESLMNTTMSGRITRELDVDGRPGIVAEISGRGQVTGMHQFVVDPADSIEQGFVLL